MTNGQPTHWTISLLPDGKQFSAFPGEPLLAAGHRAGFTFPQACRNGNCLRCEGFLLHGDVEHLRSHECISSRDEKKHVLPCIVEARSHCTLAIDGVFAPGELPVLTVAAQVTAVETLSHNVARALLRLPAGKKIARLAGQYLEIVDGENAYAFSIASPPESGREIELHVRFGEDNPSSLRVMAMLVRGAVVTLRLPMGDCTLAGEPRLPLMLVAGSTGFAQVKSLVEHAIAQGWKVPLSIYWGARTPEDFYLLDIAKQWAREHDNIRFVPIVSGPEATVGSKASAGFRYGPVHEAALADVLDADNLLVYACGSPPMVYAVQDAFVARGILRERIFSDVFAWAPR